MKNHFLLDIIGYEYKFLIFKVSETFFSNLIEVEYSALTGSKKARFTEKWI